MKIILMLLLFLQFSKLQAQLPIDSSHHELLQTFGFQESGINARIDLLLQPGEAGRVFNKGDKKQKRVWVWAGNNYCIAIEAQPASFTSDQTMLGYTKDFEIKTWYKQHPNDPSPEMILNEPNAYILKMGKEIRIQYVVTIDKIRYTLDTPHYLWDLATAHKYMKMFKTFFPK